MSETPLFDELKDKWDETYTDKAICDTYWPVIHVQTGQTWFEDDEGNEVFPESDLDEPQYSPGGYIGQFPELHKAIFEDRTYCPVSNVAVDRPKREEFEELQELYKVEIIRHEPLPPKRKFKLFGRNQGTNGTL